MSYPRIIKEAALEKMFHTDFSLRHIADELGIPRATLQGWKRQYQMIKNDPFRRAELLEITVVKRKRDGMLEEILNIDIYG